MFDTLLESRRAPGRGATSAGAFSLAAHVAAVAMTALLASGDAPRTNRVDAAEHVPLYALLRFDEPTAASAGVAGRGPGSARRGTAATRARLAPLPHIDLAALDAAVAADVTRFDRDLRALTTGPQDFPDSGAAERVLDAISGQAASGRGLPSLQLPVERPAVALNSNPRPEYPESLRLAHVEGDVRMQFLVDTTGAPDLRSARVLRSTNELFTNAVRSVLPRLRFLPAESGGNKVAVVAEQTFSFVIAR